MIYIYGNDLNLIDRYNNSLRNFNYKIIDNTQFSLVKSEDIMIISNINFEKESNLEIIENLNQEGVRIIILDPVPTFEKGRSFISMGIKAYANMMINDIHLKDVIDSVKDGNIWLYPEFINETVQRMRYETNPNAIDEKLKLLSNREKEVAILVLKKLSYLEISEQLNITIRTVKAHTKSIYEKFNVSNRLAFLLLFNR